PVCRVVWQRDGSTLVLSVAVECVGDVAVELAHNRLVRGVFDVLGGVVFAAGFADGSTYAAFSGRGHSASSSTGAYVVRAMVTWWPSAMNASQIVLSRFHASAAWCSGMSSMVSSRSVSLAMAFPSSSIRRSREHRPPSGPCVSGVQHRRGRRARYRADRCVP